MLFRSSRICDDSAVGPYREASKIKRLFTSLCAFIKCSLDVLPWERNQVCPDLIPWKSASEFVKSRFGLDFKSFLLEVQKDGRVVNSSRPRSPGDYLNNKGDRLTNSLLRCSQSMMRSGALIQGVCEITKFHFGQSVWNSFDFAVIVYFILDLFGRLEETVKISTVYFSSKVIGEEPPLIPSNMKPVLLGYHIDRKLGRFRGRSHKCLSLAMDILNLKRCCPTVSDEFIRRAMQKHFVAIAGRFGQSRKIEDPKVVVQELPACVLREMSQLFQDHYSDVGMPDPLKLEVPSSSASFELKRSDGGPEALLLNLPFHYHDHEGLTEGTESRNNSTRIVQDIFSRYHVDSNDFRVTERIDNFLSIPQGLLHAVRHSVLVPSRSCLKAEAVPISEPCKVRVITKGETVPYLALKSFQVSVSKWLGKHSCFKLTRSSFSETDVRDFLEASVKFYGVGKKLRIVSADYSSATDNLRSDLSNKIAQEFRQFFGQSYVDLVTLGLTGHVVHYKREYFDKMPEEATYEDLTRDDGTIITMTDSIWNGDVDKSFPPLTRKERTRVRILALQQGGQLMGSYASFVVLCIANYSIIAANLRRIAPDNWQGPLPLLVNGDDALFCVPEEGDTYREWSEMTTLCGLALSPGKNYSIPWDPCGCSPSFCMINSKCFQITGMQIRFVPYINGGLLRGWTKLSAEYWNLLSAENGIASRFNQLIAGFSGFKAWELAKSFIRWWSWALFNGSIIPSNVPWYLPETFGGLGFKPIEILGVLCFPGRELSETNLRTSYGIYVSYRGRPIQFSRQFEQKSEGYGGLTRVRAVERTVYKIDEDEVSFSGVTQWRSLTRRFKTETTRLNKKTAVLQDHIDRLATKGGYKFIFSSSPIVADDIPLGWTMIEEANPLLCSIISEREDDPSSEMELRLEEDEKFPEFGTEADQRRHLRFLRGVREWKKYLERFYHFKLPPSPQNGVENRLDTDSIVRLLWRKQFIIPLVRHNTYEGLSSDNPHLFLFPGPMTYEGKVWDSLDLDPCFNDQGKNLVRVRNPQGTRGIQYAYHSMKNRTCTAEPYSTINHPEGMNPLGSLQTQKCVIGSSWSMEEKYGLLRPADGNTTSDCSMGADVLTAVPGSVISEDTPQPTESRTSGIEMKEVVS